MSLKPPQQKRSRKTLSRIEAAGIAILGEKGPEGLTVQEVVARARTSVGSFYQRFAGKDELLRHLEGARAEQERARFDETLAARLTPDMELSAKVETIVALLAAEASDDTKAALDARSDAVARALLVSRAEIRHPNPEAAIRIASAAAAGVLRAPSPGLDREKVAAEVTRLWLSYLVGGGSAGGNAGAVDFFEVWG